MSIKEVFKTLFNVETPPPPPPKECSINWKTVAKVAVVSALVVGIGIAAYHYAQPLPPLTDRNLRRALTPLCDKAVRAYCKTSPPGARVCLRDYLSKDWKAYPTIEEFGRQIICPVHVQSDSCATLVGQPTIQAWAGEQKIPFVFRKNYERIPAYLPQNFPDVLRRTLAKAGMIESNGNFHFKSHVFCFDAIPVTS